MIRRPRRGMTLVEVVAAMTILMVVAAVAAALIESLLRIESAGREHAAHEAAVARAAKVFRDDVRASSTAARSGSGRRLALGDRDGGWSIRYRVEGDVLSRSEWDGFSPIRRDQFALPPKASARFEVSEEEGRTVVALVLDRRARTHDGESAVRPIRMEATLNAGRRFEGGPR